MAEGPLSGALLLGVTHRSGPLQGRVAWRLLPIITGMLFAQGRKTVVSWLRAGGLGKDHRDYYYFLGSVGRKAHLVSSWLLRLAVTVIAPGDRLLFALDDTPTQRNGPPVEGAGLHHNPTPGPAEQQFLYGPLWVTAPWVVRHPRWGTIGLPLRAFLSMRQQQIPWLQRLYEVKFETKLEQGAALVEWWADWLQYLSKPIGVVADGAYAKKPFLRRALAAAVVSVSRLHKDAALRSWPWTPRRGEPSRRGRQTISGQEAISLAKRTGHRHGWETADLVLYNKTVRKTYKTFLATYVPVGGVIRVVLVREEDN